MKELRPSADFVSRVMESVHGWESLQERRERLADKLVTQWPLRRAMSVCGVFYWVLFSPAVCI